MEEISKCVAGCKHFTGGEIKHHKDCPYYPESMSKMYDDLKNEVKSLRSFKSRSYQIDFGNHLRCKVKVDNNEVEVQAAVNGWGESVPIKEVIIVELNN